MIGCLRTRVRKQPIIALYFESENELKIYNFEARNHTKSIFTTTQIRIATWLNLRTPTFLKTIVEYQLTCGSNSNLPFRGF